MSANVSAKYSKSEQNEQQSTTSPTTSNTTVTTTSDNELNKEYDADVITLNYQTKENNKENTNATTPIATPEQIAALELAAAAVETPTTTSTPNALKKYFSKRPTNLSLKINNKNSLSPTASSSNGNNYAETENATLSNATITITTTSPSSSTDDSPSLYATARPYENESNPAEDTMFPHEQYKTLKKLDIGFDNIKFTARVGFFSKGYKDIINGPTGIFRSGELSAIIGPSGAGKSTLLNILSAYTPHGYTGDVTVNGHLRDIKAFKPNIAFITQDTSLQPFLTVKEAMHFSANLKIGTHMSKGAKRERVRKILEAIGMYENRHTRTGNLSGGQKKRLAIALELVNNPPVLILDEPTSGLDSSTSNQCISLLKKLAMEGRTVICTIHQPSALAFGMFDHLYAIAEGRCIYSGGTQNLVPFLADVGLECPEFYNPADYLMEIATHDYGVQNPKLVEKIDNGRNDSFRQTKSERKVQVEAMQKIDKMMAAGMMTPVTAPVLSPPPTSIQSNYPPNNYQHFKQLTPINEMSSKVWDSSGLLNDKHQVPTTTEESKRKSKKETKPNGKPANLDPAKLCTRENIYATPFYRQLSILLLRTFLILWRDKSLTTMRFVIHFVTAILIGFLYYDIGNDASNALNSFRYIFYTIMFIMYCAFSSILVNFPLEFPIVSREHFNRWYSLRAYYVAMTLADIPIQVICTSLFIAITYFLTDQPRELYRVGLFAFIVFLTALVGQSIGLAVGASLSITLGCILGPFFICPFLAFSGFFLQEKDAPGWLHWLFKSSFLKYSLDGATVAIFGFDRPKLECHQMYCHHMRPKIFLKDLDMEGADYVVSVIVLISIFLGLRIIAFYIMSFRLRLFR